MYTFFKYTNQSVNSMFDLNDRFRRFENLCIGRGTRRVRVWPDGSADCTCAFKCTPSRDLHSPRPPIKSEFLFRSRGMWVCRNEAVTRLRIRVFFNWEAFFESQSMCNAFPQSRSDRTIVHLETIDRSTRLERRKSISFTHRDFFLDFDFPSVFSAAFFGTFRTQRRAIDFDT